MEPVKWAERDFELPWLDKTKSKLDTSKNRSFSLVMSVSGVEPA